MITGNDLILSARHALRDVPSATRAGAFYSDTQILLALNAAQDMVVQHIATQQVRSLGERLVRTANVDSTGTLAYPVGCVRVFGARVAYGTAPHVKERTAKVYEGREAIAYLHTNHTACYVIGNTITLKKKGVVSAGTVLFWTMPNPISATSTPLEGFADDVYRVVLSHAVALLGLRDTLHDADSQSYMRSVQSLMAISQIPM